MTAPEKVNILGVRFDRVRAAEAAERICGALRERGADEVPFRVVTPNPTMVMNASRNPELARALAGADLSVADGIGIVAAARRAGEPLPERVAGIDTGYAVLSYCAGASLRVFFLGGRAGVAERAAEKLREKMPGLTVCGTHDGFFPEERSGEVCREITGAGADLLIVCLGSPRQEIWAAQHKDDLRGVGAVMTLGGSFDVWAGLSVRAPRAVRRMRLEWAWRMLAEPRRMKFLPDMVRFRMRTRRKINGKNAER